MVFHLLYAIFAVLLITKTYKTMKKNILTLVVVALLCVGATQAQQRPRYTIHTTPNTKTIVIEGGVRWAHGFNDGLAVVGGNNSWFVIDKQGNKVFSIPQGYTPQPNSKQDGFVGYDSNRLTIFSESSNHAIIYDNTGKIVKEYKDAVNASGFRNGVALIAIKEKNPKGWGSNTVWYYIDVNGNKLTKDMPPSFYGWSNYRLFKLVDGLARVWDDDIHKWGFRNIKCQWVIKPTFYRVHDFSDGLAVAKQEENGKWGYIDKTGNWVIQPIYSNEPGDFNCGRARVTDKNNCVHYIDKTGNLVWTDPDPVRCDEYGSYMSTGYALWCFAPREGYLVDTSFKKKIRLPEFFNKISDYEKEYYVLPESPGHNGTKVFDWNGNLLLEYREGRDWFSNGIGYKDNYYFNMQGEIIVKFEDTQF